MAYSPDNPPLLMVTPPGKRGGHYEPGTGLFLWSPAFVPQFYMYSGTDGINVITANGYIANGVEIGMQVGDWIFYTLSNTPPVGYILMVTGLNMDGSANLSVTITNSGGTGSVAKVTSGSSFSVASGVTFVGVNKASGSATSIVFDVTKMLINIPVQVVDQKGDAATNNITLSELSGVLLNGASNFVITANREAVSVTYDGSGLNVT